MSQLTYKSGFTPITKPERLYRKKLLQIESPKQNRSRSYSTINKQGSNHGQEFILGEKVVYHSKTSIVQHIKN